MFITTWACTAFAQVSITLKDVAKIHLVDGSGSLGSYFRNDYDLVRENGKWVTYQVHEKFRGYDLKSSKAGFEQRDSAERRFISVISDDSIRSFLNTIRTIKPKFNAADLELSIPKLTKQIDTTFLKNRDKKRIKLFNSFFNTPVKLYGLMDTLQHDYWTDDYPYSVIEIIKQKGDTVKVITNRQVDYMLPWRINEVPTYDVSINKFFIYATNLRGHRMSGKYLSSHLYTSVGFLHAYDAFERLRWKDLSPQNVKYLEQHFDIFRIRQSNSYSDYSFHSYNLDKHVVISGDLNIENKNQLTALVNYAEDTLKTFLKSGGFMIDSCINKKGCTINFNNRYGASWHGYFSFFQKGLADYLNQYKTEELRPFSIKMGDRIEDNWVALPDGRFVLTAYLDDHIVGVSPAYYKKDGQQMRKFVFMIFDHDGRLRFKGE